MKALTGFVGKLLTNILLLAVLFSYAMFQGGFVSWFLFYSFLPLIIYMLILLLYPIRLWKITRELSQHVLSAGDSLTVNLRIKRKFPFPIYYCIIEEYVPESLDWKDTLKEKYRYLNNPELAKEKRKVKTVLYPWFKRNFHYQYKMKHVSRGEHDFGAIRIKVGDFFGFVKKEVIFPVNNKVIVYPNTRDIHLKERVNSFEEGTSPAFTLNIKDATVVSGVREYMPGDRFSWIDWKASAKKNTVMTKEFEQQKSFDMMLILDATASTNQNKLAFEASVELTSSLIKAYRVKSSQLAFLSLGQGRVFFPFHHDQQHRDKIYNYLATASPKGDVTFSEVFGKELSRIPQGLITMMITASINEDLQYHLEKLQQKSRRVVLFLIKSSSEISQQDKTIIQHLTSTGIIVNLLTEQELIQQRFEVNT